MSASFVKTSMQSSFVNDARFASCIRVMVLTPEVRTFVLLSNSLRSLGCQVTRAASLGPAIQLLRGTPHDLLFLDSPADADPSQWIPQLLAENYSLRIVAMTGLEQLDCAVRCLRAGAQDCLAKPVDPLQLRRIVNQTPVAGIGGTDDGSASTASCMRLAMDSVRRAAQSDLPVMLRGEHGTGKTMFAEFLHRHSRRAQRPFITVNCPSLSEELATSELFGHRRGSFTGAVADQLGKVEAAEGGSLFLDELGDLPASVQARILRFLQDHSFERLGETITRHADVRLITATNRDLERLIANGSFRPDLFFRLSGIEITIPALRERRSDVLVLANRFLSVEAAKLGRECRLSEDAANLLTAYEWPGNVRELSNEIQRAVVMSKGPVILPGDLSPRLRGSSPNSIYLGGDFTLRQVGDEHVAQVLRRYGKVGHVARVLDIERSTLLTKRRRLGISNPHPPSE